MPLFLILNQSTRGSCLGVVVTASTKDRAREIVLNGGTPQNVNGTGKPLSGFDTDGKNMKIIKLDPDYRDSVVLESHLYL